MKNEVTESSFKFPKDAIGIIKTLKDLGVIGAVIGSFFLFNYLMRPDIDTNTAEIKIIKEKIASFSADDIKAMKEKVIKQEMQIEILVKEIQFLRWQGKLNGK